MRGKKPTGKGRAKGNWTKQEKGGHSPFKRDQQNFRKAKPKNIPKLDDTIRLNKFLANAGVCSRREADTIIKAGIVEVNGVIVTELGIKVNPNADTIKYGGETLSLRPKHYFILNKPKDFVTNKRDWNHRRSVLNLVRGACKEFIYPVGKLDRHATGLLLMTNDDDMAKKLTHPAVKIRQIYHVSLKKPFAEDKLRELRDEGIETPFFSIKPASVEYVKGDTSKREVGIEIYTNKNKAIEKIFNHYENEIVKLDRVIYGGLTKKDLPKGRFRALSTQEIINLKNL